MDSFQTLLHQIQETESLLFQTLERFQTLLHLYLVKVIQMLVRYYFQPAPQRLHYYSCQQIQQILVLVLTVVNQIHHHHLLGYQTLADHRIHHQILEWFQRLAWHQKHRHRLLLRQTLDWCQMQEPPQIHLDYSVVLIHQIQRKLHYLHLHH